MPDPATVHGKVCYIQMPAKDIEVSAAFYTGVFGWTTRLHDDGTLAFDDATGQVSGMWQTDLTAAADPGMIISIMVRDVTTSMAEVIAAGGSIESMSDPEDSETLATFRDPAGNLLCLYQDPGFE
ncbi:MAG: VOC family protein [Thermomicrobiales bacterium]